MYDSLIGRSALSYRKSICKIHAFHSERKSIELPIFYFKGSQVEISKLHNQYMHDAFLAKKIVFTFVNSADRDEMPASSMRYFI